MVYTQKKSVSRLLEGAVIALFFLFFILPGSAAAATIVVNSVDDETGTDGDCTLRDAIRAANTNVAVDGCTAGQASVIDEIMIPAGTYTLSLVPGAPNENAALAGDLDISQSVVLAGAGRDTTIIDAGRIDRVFHVVGGVNLAVTFQDMTIRNGCANGGTCASGGGGIQMGTTGNVLVDSVIVENSQGNVGGGLQAFSGGTLNVTVRESIIRNNTAMILGGGISSINNVLIEYSLFEGNTTVNGGNGGGIGVSSGTTTIVHSEISNNITSGHGGGISVQGSNTGGYGTLIMRNTTLSGNRADGNGGGIYVNGGLVTYPNNNCYPNACSATLTNVTITNNTADYINPMFPTGNGGGIFVNTTTGSNNAPGVLTMTNTIVALNTDQSGSTAPDCSGAITSNGYNMVGSVTGCTFNALPSDYFANPLLGSLMNNGGFTRTHALLLGSPAIDAGLSCEATDQRGITRPQGLQCDIGAFELEVTVTPFCGNTVVESGEACDDGNTDTLDACTNVCEAAVCGDTFVYSGVEQCDDGNTTNGDGCSALCEIEVAAPVCGNTIVEAGEQCDDGNADNTDTCTNTCAAAFCGDMFVQTGVEQCDDGNTANGDGCSMMCEIEIPAPICGNSLIEEGEMCDDGNTLNGDGCDMSCQEETPTQPQIDLQLTTTVSPAAVVVGQTNVFTLAYGNNGPDTATLVTVNATVPSNAMYSATGSLPTVWSCTNNGGPNALCTTTLSGSIAQGATGTVRFGVQATSAGVLQSIATIKSADSLAIDLNEVNNGVTYLQNRTFRSIYLGPDRLTNSVNPAGSTPNIANLLIPDSYTGQTQLPLVIPLHGLDGSFANLNQQFNFGFTNGVNSRGYFLIMANGSRGTNNRPHWNATDECCSANAGLTPATDVDDVAYIRDLILEAQAHVAVDPRRVYVTGFSNGAFMSYRLACELPQLIAAIAPIAGATFQNEASCLGALPVSVLHIHGTADQAVSYYDFDFDHDADPATAPLLDRPNVPGAQQTLERWVLKAGCSLVTTALPNISFIAQHNRTYPAPTTLVGVGAETIVRAYQTNCQAGFTAELWEVPQYEHGGWYEYQGVNASTLILDWLFNHSRP